MTVLTNGPSLAYLNFQSEARNVRRRAENALNGMIAGDISAATALAIMREMQTFIGRIDTVSVVPAIQDRAQEWEGAGYDFLAESATLRAFGVIVRDWVFDNFPKSPGGYIEQEILSGNGSLTERTFSTQQTAGLQAALASFIAAIEPIV